MCDFILVVGFGLVWVLEVVSDSGVFGIVFVVDNIVLRIWGLIVNGCGDIVVDLSWVRLVECYWWFWVIY